MTRLGLLTLRAAVAAAALAVAGAALAQAPARARPGGVRIGARPRRRARRSRPAAAARLPPRPGQVESDPIRCWWKTDRTSVRVGETFGLTLTCGVIETGPIAVVPALTQLEGGAIQLTPFEVVSATRRADVVVPPWRYVQFEYAVRLLNDGYFGQDVSLPALTVTYNLKSAGAESAGRDQSYVLPALPMRILSLVPRAANDIRDASSLTFAEIESRRYYSTAARVAAAIALVFAAVFAVLAVLRFAQRFRVRTPASARPVPAASLLAGCASALRGVQKDARADGLDAGAGAPRPAGHPHCRRLRARPPHRAAAGRGRGGVAGGAGGRAHRPAGIRPRRALGVHDPGGHRERARPALGGRPGPHRADAARRRAAGVRPRRVRPSAAASRWTAPRSIARSRTRSRPSAASASAPCGRCARWRAWRARCSEPSRCTSPRLRGASASARHPPAARRAAAHRGRVEPHPLGGSAVLRRPRCRPGVRGAAGHRAARAARSARCRAVAPAARTSRCRRCCR